MLTSLRRYASCTDSWLVYNAHFHRCLQAWSAIKDLLGGEERINEDASSWGDSFIVNLGTKELEGVKERTPPEELGNWHVDGDFFVIA